MDNQNQVTSYSTESIHAENKQSWVKIFSVWTGLVFSVSTMLYGGVVGSQLPLGQALIAIGIANLFLAVITTLVSFIGADTGLGAFELLKYCFGVTGGKIITIIRLTLSLGWVGIGSILVVDLVSFFIPFFATPVGFAVGGIVINLLFVATVWTGFKGLTFLTRFAIPAIVLIFLVALFQTERLHGIATLFDKEPVNPTSLLVVVTGIIFAWIDVVMVGSNFSRFARSKKDTTIATGLAFLLGASVIYCVGAITALATGKDNVPEIFNALGIAGLAGALVFLLTWTTSSEAFYAASLGFASVFPIKNKAILLFFPFAIATVFTLIDLFEYFIQWVGLMGLIFCPIIGVLLADYYFFKAKYRLPVDRIKTVISIPSVIGLAVGVATNLLIPVYGALLAIVTTMAAYYIANRFIIPDKMFALALQESQTTNKDVLAENDASAE